MVDTLTIPSEDKGPTLEEQSAAQDAAVKVVVEPKLAGEEDTPERPEWLPAKFKSVEDMAKAYADLENKLGKGEEKPEVDPEATAEDAVSSAGLDMDALSSEYETNGSLTPESMSKLKAVGISEDMVNSYIKGQTAQADNLRNELVGPIGGVEVYGEVIGWATNNLPDAEIDAFNSILSSNNQSAIKLAVQSLHSKYVENTGTEPERQLSGKGTANATGTYGSTVDLMKDMQNPEYAKNPTFRAKVEAKLSRSSIL